MSVESYGFTTPVTDGITAKSDLIDTKRFLWTSHVRYCCHDIFQTFDTFLIHEVRLQIILLPLSCSIQLVSIMAARAS